MLVSVVSLSALGQGFAPPKEGKSVVYFTRTSKYQHYAAFVLFDGDRFIADFPGQTYFRYECEPGKHLFWASAENKDFITAELKPNGSYVVMVESRAGQGMPKVYLTPMIGRHKGFHTAKWFISNKAPETENAEKVAEENKRMAAFIKKSLDEYAAIPEEEKASKHLSADMDLPIEKF